MELSCPSFGNNKVYIRQREASSCSDHVDGIFKGEKPQVRGRDELNKHYSLFQPESTIRVFRK